MSGSPAYDKPDPLLARLAIYAWQRDRVDLADLVEGALAGVSGVVIDVGCGPGRYARRLAEARPDLHVATTDLSAGMHPLVVADAARLPYRDAAAGAALAMHMLYHVPDIPAAVAELRRVVRAGGVVLVSTNGRDDEPELKALMGGVLDALGGGAETFASPAARFTASDGDLLEVVFDHVGLQAFERVVEVPAVAPVVAYVESLRAFHEDALPAGVTWERFVAAVRDRAALVVEREGAFRFTTRPALFACR